MEKTLIRNITKYPTAESLIHTLCNLLIIYFCTRLLIPLNPIMPSFGLDPSWRFAINQAVAQNLQFGKDIIFTFGPYSTIYSKTYHPATDSLMLFSGALLAIAYSGCLIYYLKKVHTLWRLSFVLVFSFFAGSMDALLFLYPALTSLVVIDISHSQKNTHLYSKDLYWAFFYQLILGLLPLIKFSFLIMVVPAIIANLIFYLAQKNYRNAILTTLFPIAGFLFFWIIAGQSPANIFSYIDLSIEIMSGYSQAMSHPVTILRPNTLRSISVYLAFSASILITLVFEERKPSPLKPAKIFLLTCYFFACEKAGIVRHDREHSLIIANAMVFSSLFIATENTIKKEYFFSIILSIFLAVFYLENNDVLSNNFEDISFLQEKRNNNLTQEYQSSIKKIQSMYNLPSNTEGSADIFSYHQSALIAAGINWNPRPVLQGYSAYTPKLATKDSDHLHKKSAPDNIFFRMESIDSRFPAMDSGRYLLELLNTYKLDTTTKNRWFLIFKKDKNNKKLKKGNQLDGTSSFNTEINLPQGQIVFISANIRPTPLGRLANIFLYTPPINMTLLLKNGERISARIIPKMMESGFTLSPLLKENADLENLIQHKTNRTVDKIIIDMPDSNKKFWESHFNYTLTIFSINDSM